MEALLNQLKVSIPKLEASQGCLTCRVLQHQEERGRLVVLEEWIIEEEHEAAVKIISRAVFLETMKLLAEPPYGESYRNVDVG
jgi:heme oxygenase (mycobilin-producing)